MTSCIFSPPCTNSHHMVPEKPPKEKPCPDLGRHVLIISTATEENAREIAGILVKDRLAACINLLPVRSVYHWEGAVCDEHEHMMLVKTTRDRMDAAIAAIRRHHRYELPEVITLPITGGSPEFLAWLGSETAV